MLSKVKFYLLIAAEIGWALIAIGVATFLLEKYNVKNKLIIEIFVLIAFALTSGWIPTYSYRKYSESEKLQEETEFWRSWKKR